MEASVQEKLNPDQDLRLETKISQDFYKFLNLNENSNSHDEEEEEFEEDDEKEEEFSFMCGGEDATPITAEDAFTDGQIKAVFPLFNRDLLFSGDNSDSLHENLPMRPPVKKVFVETNDQESSHHQQTSSTPGNDEIVGPYCEWRSSRKAVEASPPAEGCKKSNSTGFSKIWRFKEFRERCNSDGRDAFVFLNGSHAPPPAKQQPAAMVEEKREKTETAVKISGKVKKSNGKSKKALSAHEVYLRSKAKEEERRRSYLPYRPELMGFFTNVNGGLTRNVHPF